jgi:ASC-1-like (ASCH) protein
MSEFQTTLSSPHFENVKNGKKKYEVRCFCDKVINYKVGDVLQIKHNINSETFKVKIVSLNECLSFEEALSSVSLDEVLPGVKTIE